MPRRKQDCPKRMKWELENAEAAAAAAAAAAAGGTTGDSLLLEGKSIDGAKGDLSGCSDNGDLGSDSDDSGGNLPSPNSRGSTPPSPSVRSSHQKNGSVLDFSSRGAVVGVNHLIVPSSSPPMISPRVAIAPPIVGLVPRDGPLDLSVSHKKSKDVDDGPVKKLPKWSIESNASSGSKSSWNGTSPGPPDMSSKALEKMSEMTRGQSDAKLASPSTRGNSGSTSSWQAQWLAQNSTGARDILKCVVCRATFSTLAALSHHMKESKHGPPVPNLPSPKMPPQTSPIHPPVSTPSSSNDSLLLKGTGCKETVQLPRKLVRGQDVWLGKGAEQTRQILKCMWCGQSFRSLAEMTSHMQQTQHYTNIISQEQLISWRSSEDKTSSTNSHVSAVLTCKVCDQAFSSLKELSNHMVKNSHYKEHIMRSITESGSRRRQSREKRKKSLPVRKLLELERANQEMKKEIRISCEKCSEKIPAPLFVEHLRVCESGKLGGGGGSGGGTSSGGSSPLKQPTPSPKRDSNSEPPQDLSVSTKDKGGNNGGDGDKNESSAINAIEKMIEKSFDYRNARSQVAANLGPSPPIGTSILKRLGIDESVDYTKPLVDPSVVPIPPNKYSIPPRSRSVSSDKSEDAAKSHISNSSSPALLLDTKDESKSPMSRTKSPATESDTGMEDNHRGGTPSSDIHQHHSHSHSHHHHHQQNHKSSSNNSINNNSLANKKSNQSSLSALSSMFESIGGSGGGGGSGGSENNSSSKNSSTGGGNNSGGGGGGNNFPSSNSHHPLAALQKLCDKTENTPAGSVNSRPTSTSSSNPQSSPEPTLLGMNWAAAAAAAAAASATGDSPTTTDGNVFKCTFCDTPFLSKGAYRHHLAKMHFVKEKSPHGQDNNVAVAATTVPVINAKEEPTINSSDSPASKFIKYTELAKQLSSK